MRWHIEVQPCARWDFLDALWCAGAVTLGKHVPSEEEKTLAAAQQEQARKATEGIFISGVSGKEGLRTYGAKLSGKTGVESVKIVIYRGGFESLRVVLRPKER